MQDTPDRIAQLRPIHRRWAKRFGGLLLIVAAVIAVSYYDSPLVVFDRPARVVIGIVGYVALIGFGYFGGMSVFLWWLSRSVRK